MIYFIVKGEMLTMKVKEASVVLKNVLESPAPSQVPGFLDAIVIAAIVLGSLTVEQAYVVDNLCAPASLDSAFISARSVNRC